MTNKITNRHELAERLEMLGHDLRYDIRANALVEGERRLHDRDIDLIVDTSYDGKGPPLPTMRSDYGTRIWHAFMTERAFDPLVEWFEACGVEYGDRLDPANLPQELWPDRTNYAHKIVRWSWRAFFVAVMARALAPPVRWDVVPIIIGEQGCGKSTAATNLLPHQWTNGGFPLKGVKDFDASRKTMEFTEGKAILESSEMVGLNAGNREIVKSFISRDHDRATRKYAIQAEDVPRRWCIIGTSNDAQPIPYDPSGGRRWIVTQITGTEATDGKRIHDYLVANRERYWAWAYHLVKKYVRLNEVESRLSVPESLAQEHAEHAARFMWRKTHA